jgi:hypothetical protein
MAEHEINNLRLARENAHPLDEHIVFDEPSHTYTVDGDVIFGSVSSLWGSRFEQFDALGTARRCYPKWSQKAERGFEADVWNYTEHYVRLVEGGNDAAVAAAGVPGPVSAGEKGYSCLLKHLWAKGWGAKHCVEAIVALWSMLGQEASARGTYVHLQCELHCNDEPYDEHAVEVRQYLDFRAQYPNLTPYRSEWSVFARSGKYIITGQIDAIFKDAEDGAYVMVDYKVRHVNHGRAMALNFTFNVFDDRIYLSLAKVHRARAHAGESIREVRDIPLRGRSRHALRTLCSSTEYLQIHTGKPL